MGYYINHVIAIEQCGSVTAEELVPIIANAARETEQDYNIDEQRLGWCLSKELTGPKGGWFVIAGTFNNWLFDSAAELSAKISAVLRTRVLHSCWDEEIDAFKFQAFKDGEPFFRKAKSPRALPPPDDDMVRWEESQGKSIRARQLPSGDFEFTMKAGRTLQSIEVSREQLQGLLDAPPPCASPDARTHNEAARSE